MDKMMVELSESNRKLEKENQKLHEMLKASEEILGRHDGFQSLKDRLAELVDVVDSFKENEMRLRKAVEIYKSGITFVLTSAETIRNTGGSELQGTKAILRELEPDEQGRLLIETYTNGVVDGVIHLRDRLLLLMNDMLGVSPDEGVDE